jgi:hypothetical protein
VAPILNNLAPATVPPNPVPAVLFGTDVAPSPGRATAPFAPTASARIFQAVSLLKANGCWPPKDGQVFAIQIDQDCPLPGSKDSGAFLKTYSGQTAVFRARLVDGSIRLSEVSDGVIKSASHPGQTQPLPGYKSVAWVRSGVYECNGRGYQHIARIGYAFDIPGKLPAAGDQNKDGSISADESAIPRAATEVLFHAGNPDAPRSGGCQTFPPNEFKKFRAAIDAQKSTAFTYLLIRRPNDKTGAYAW